VGLTMHINELFPHDHALVGLKEMPNRDADKCWYNFPKDARRTCM